MAHTSLSLTAANILPEDSDDALLVGRVWAKAVGGPSPVILRGGRVHDLSGHVATIASLLEKPDAAAWLSSLPDFPDLGPLDAFLSGEAGELLAPVDLQAIKAAGVTFAGSMLERVIEE